MCILLMMIFGFFGLITIIGCCNAVNFLEFSTVRLILWKLAKKYLEPPTPKEEAPTIKRLREERFQAANDTYESDLKQVKERIEEKNSNNETRLVTYASGQIDYNNKFYINKYNLAPILNVLRKDGFCIIVDTSIKDTIYEIRW